MFLLSGSHTSQPEQKEKRLGERRHRAGCSAGHGKTWRNRVKLNGGVNAQGETGNSFRSLFRGVLGARRLIKPRHQTLAVRSYRAQRPLAEPNNDHPGAGLDHVPNR